MFVDRGPKFNAVKFWFCQLPNASYSWISKALLILSARFSEDNEVIWSIGKHQHPSRASLNPDLIQRLTIKG